MEITYTLSVRQQKELVARAQKLRLALPFPSVQVKDLMDWARSVLPSDYREMVVEAEEMHLFVQPKARLTTPRNLTELLGAIVPSDAKWGWVVRHHVVLTTLQFSKNPHGSTLTQWPQNVRIDGEPLLASNVEVI